MTQLNITNGDTNAIQYEVVKQHAISKAKGVDIFCARVSASPISLRDVAETMVREGLNFNSNVVVYILENFADVVIRLLKEGRAVNVGSLVRFRPSIIGTFKSKDDAYSAGSQRIKIRATVGSVLRDVAARASTHRLSAVPSAILQSVFNTVTGEENILSAGLPFLVHGRYLTWNANATDEGFFITREGQRVRCTTLTADNGNQMAILNAPQDLTEGETVQLSFSTRNTTDGSLATITYATDLMVKTSTAD